MSQLGSSVCIFRRKSTTAAALEQHDYYCWPPPSPTGSRPAPLIATMACVVGASVDVRHVHVPSLCQVQNARRSRCGCFCSSAVQLVGLPNYRSIHNETDCIPTKKNKT
nr:uncharacterized protein LOC109762774 isoform X2 [Aegilops tauschii subsp. strangulata]